VISIRRIVAVVPAKDEELLLSHCLDALRRASRAVNVPVTVVVAVYVRAATCRDRTLDIARSRPDVVTLPVHDAVVGSARHAGVLEGLRRVGALSVHSDKRITWIVTTDADSQVRPDWLVTQQRLADAGADLVLGTVDLRPAAGLDHVAAAWRHEYHGLIGPDQQHPHVHGANLGVRANAYLAVGGFPAAAAHEDVRLTVAVRALGRFGSVTTTMSPVTTSDRRSGRTPHGVAADLQRIAAG
jgi:hypothetical protein